MLTLNAQDIKPSFSPKDSLSSVNHEIRHSAKQIDVQRAIEQALHNHISRATSTVDLERCEEFSTALTELKTDLLNPRTGIPFYIMEGATGVPEDHGRPSTDPDENMALKSIHMLTTYRDEPAIVAVPDEANQKRTTEVLRSWGAKVSEKGEQLKPGCIRVVSLQDKEEMRDVVDQTAEAPREIYVLGPPTGFAIDTLDENTRDINIMGKARLTPDGVLDKSWLSTNTTPEECHPFVEKALKMGAKAFSSKEMSDLTLSLGEISLFTNLITKEDKEHWAKNTYEQLVGIGPVVLLEKRMDQPGGALEMYEGEVSLRKLDRRDAKTERFAFLSLLEGLSKATAKSGSLEDAVEKLGKDSYNWLLAEGSDTSAREQLVELINQDKSTYTVDQEDLNTASEIISRLTNSTARITFAATALLMKSIWDEKTNGWSASNEPGEQWRAGNFLKAYLDGEGRQVPYDAIVLLTNILAPDDKLFMTKVLLTFADFCPLEENVATGDHHSSEKPH